MKKMLLFGFLGFGFTQPKLVHLEKFISDLPEHTHCIEKLLILSNYRGSDLATQQMLQVVKSYLEDLIASSNVSHGKELAASVLINFLKLEEVANYLSSQSDEFGIFAWNLLTKDPICFFKLHTLTDEDYSEMKDLFAEQYSKKINLNKMENDGFFDIIGSNIYWYPPQATINPFFKKWCDAQKAFSKIKIDPYSFTLPAAVQEISNNIVLQLKQHNLNKDDVFKSLMSNLGLLFESINQEFWYKNLSTKEIDLNQVEVSSSDKILSLAQALKVFVFFISPRAQLIDILSRGKKENLLIFADFLDSVLHSHFFGTLELSIQESLKQQASDIIFLAKEFKLATGEMLTLNQACAALVPQKISLSSLNSVSKAVDTISLALEQSVLKIESSWVVLFELAIQKMISLQSTASKKNIDESIKKLLDLMNNILAKKCCSDSSVEQSLQNLLEKSENKSGLFSVKKDASVHSNFQDYSRMINNYVADDFLSKSLFIKGISLAKTSLKDLASSSGDKVLEARYLVSKFVVDSVEKLACMKDSGWHEATLLELVYSFIEKADDSGLVEDLFVLKNVGLNCKGLLKLLAKEKAKKFVEIHHRKTLLAD